MRYDLQLFSENFEKYESLVQEGTLLIVEGTVRKTEEGYQLNTQRVIDFNKNFPNLIKSLHFILYPQEEFIRFCENLREIISKNAGSLEIKVSFYINNEYALEGVLPYGARTQLSLEDITTLRQHPSVYGVEITPTPIVPFPKKDFRKIARQNDW